ncbi:MAG TPA: calcium-binding protein [Allosphingosinicella sp.]|jgi:Ca2+-binding RTX toxin-like protein|nr:calcium-binding protein [Allosphingosinicella sp.]
MTTGTEGNDNLSNDPAARPETVDALGGDDVVTIVRPNLMFGFDSTVINVNGGAGTDTLIINDPEGRLSSAGRTGLGEDPAYQGHVFLRLGTGRGYAVNWNSIERLELTASLFGGTSNFGDEIDILRFGSSSIQGSGPATVNAGGGDDEIYVSAAAFQGTYATINGDSGNDLIDFTGVTASPGNFWFGNGGEGDDILRGSGYRDQLSGGAGNDTLHLWYVTAGQADNSGNFDVALGGAGSDNFFFGGALTQYDVVTGGADTDTLVIQGNYAGGLSVSGNVTEIENLSILGGDNTAFGEPGTNRYDYVLTINDANFAAGVQARINGAALLAGEDFTFDGSAETDAKFVVYGGKGVDTLTGGLGNDIFFYAEERFASGDTVNGGPGYDGMFLRGNYTIDFNAPGYTGLFTNIENLTLTSATDERYARGGGTEFDYNLTLSNAIVKPGETLTVSGALLMASETMVLDASQEADGFLRLFGGKADDTLKGGGQADLIHGNLGADMLTGNGGADTFRFDSTADSTSGSLDRITDFTPGTDKIDLSRIDANTLVAGDQAFTWIGSNAFSGTAGELRIENLNGSGWLLLGDTDGNGFGDLRIVLDLQGPTPLSGADFIL